MGGSAVLGEWAPVSYSWRNTTFKYSFLSALVCLALTSLDTCFLLMVSVSHIHTHTQKEQS